MAALLDLPLGGVIGGPTTQKKEEEKKGAILSLLVGRCLAREERLLKGRLQSRAQHEFRPKIAVPQITTS